MIRLNVGLLDHALGQRGDVGKSCGAAIPAHRLSTADCISSILARLSVVARYRLRQAELRRRVSVSGGVDDSRAKIEEMQSALKAGVQVIAAPQLFPTPPRWPSAMVEEATFNRIIGSWNLAPEPGQSWTQSEPPFRPQVVTVT